MFYAEDACGPGQALHLYSDAVPVLTFYFYADPDPRDLKTIQGSILSFQFVFLDFWADLDSAFHSDDDPDPASPK